MCGGDTTLWHATRSFGQVEHNVEATVDITQNFLWTWALPTLPPSDLEFLPLYHYEHQSNPIHSSSHWTTKKYAVSNSVPHTVSEEPYRCHRCRIRIMGQDQQNAALKYDDKARPIIKSSQRFVLLRYFAQWIIWIVYGHMQNKKKTSRGFTFWKRRFSKKLSPSDWTRQNCYSEYSDFYSRLPSRSFFLKRLIFILQNTDP